MDEDAIKTSGNRAVIELRELTELVEEAVGPESSWPQRRAQGIVA